MNMRMPTLKRRVDLIWIAIALTAGIGGAAFATTASGTGDGSPGSGGGLGITAVTDPGLTSSDPADGQAAAQFSVATGVAAGTKAAPQVWSVGGHSVLGYTSADGRFCFEFRQLTGGCLAAGTLTDAQPLDITIDHGPSTFRVYGIALDGVTGVTLHVGTATREADFAHNSFAVSDDALGATNEAAGEVVATMSDGTTRTQSFPISSLEAP
jgi:hypothetical protein